MRVGIIGPSTSFSKVEDVDNFLDGVGLRPVVTFYQQDGVEHGTIIPEEERVGDEVTGIFSFVSSPAREAVAAWCRRYGADFTDRSGDEVHIWLDAPGWRDDDYDGPELDVLGEDK